MDLSPPSVRYDIITAGKAVFPLPLIVPAPQRYAESQVNDFPMKTGTSH